MKAELSFRLKRQDIEGIHEPGSKHYYAALNTLIDLCDDLHNEGWDGDPSTAEEEVLPA